MNKENVFKSSEFYMSEGDILHMILLDEHGQSISVQLVSEEDPDVAEDGTPDTPVALPATNVSYTSFSANWEETSGATGYYLDVSTSSVFATFVAGFNGHEVVGALTHSVDGIASGDTFYYRVRAFNSTDTSGNSNVISADTLVVSYPLLDKDGNEYDTVAIGTQEWITSNLKVTKYANGSVIVNKTSNSDWANDVSNNSQTFGALYNLYAVIDARGIANTGWRVPAFISGSPWETDFTPLITELGGLGLAGGAMKETGLSYWRTPNTGATNSSGFNGRASGIRAGDGSFSYNFAKQVIAVNYDDDASYFYGITLDYNNDNVTESGWGGGLYNGWNTGMAIRLLKNTTTLTDGQTGTYTGNDGKTYNTICIGTQEWLSENLNETKYANGDTIPKVTDATAWSLLSSGAMCYYNNEEEGGAYCWYNNDIANKADHGALYNWNVLDNAKELAYLERNSVEETGWRIPTQGDFVTLETTLGGALIAGGKLKEIGTTHWTTPNTGATNSSGFTSLGSGIRSSAGTFSGLLAMGSHWASTAINTTTGSAFAEAYNSEEVVNYQYPKKYGYSVRLVRDITPTNQYVIFVDASGSYRKGVRNGSFVIDKALTVTGFAGAENTDWENIDNIS
jgi:uncharacterized protein (TIGR02145 family)